MKGILILAIYGLLLKAAVFVQSSCVPADDCVAAVSGTKVTDPADCHNYYICRKDTSGNMVPTPSAYICPTGQHFDGTACVDGATCTNTCAGTAPIPNKGCRTTCPPATAVLAATYTSEPILLNEEFLEGSPRATTSIGNVNDCSSFIICVDSLPTNTGTCAATTPYYNGITCVTDKTQCCDFCQPYCWEVDALIEDPADCTSYYYCMAEGAADETLRTSCSSGQYFERNAADCVAGTCTSICSATATTAGATTAAATTAAGTTAAGTTATTSTATTTAGCKSLSAFTCPTPTANFARCPYCDPTYFRCVNSVATVQNCPMNEVFNPVSSYPYCIPFAECPRNS